jgi:hypothetical protein
VVINITDVKIRSEVCSFVSKHRRILQVNMKVVKLVHCSFSETTVSTDLRNSYQAGTRLSSQATKGALHYEGLFDGYITDL